MLRIGDKQDTIFPISSDRISTILKSVIKEAGMDTSIITTRCFRSGGVSYGVERGVQPAQLMKIGRWKSADVFFNNYVAARPAKDTTDRMLGIEEGTSPIKKSFSAI